MKFNQISIESPATNFTLVHIGTNRVYYSYSTIIAFRVDSHLYISENIWGTTTGKHLNYINSAKEIHIPNDEFNLLLDTLELSN